LLLLLIKNTLRFVSNFSFVVFATDFLGIVNHVKKNRSNQTSRKQSENNKMSTQEQARALMMRHHHLIKNRQQSMLGRGLMFKASRSPASAQAMTAAMLHSAKLI
jgi:hypothetical protein